MKQRRRGEGNRARLLMMAFDCSPFAGSEAGMGWHSAVEAARYCDTWVICEEKKWRTDIERFCSRENLNGLEFVFLPEKAWASWAWKIRGFGYLSYRLWQRRALEVAKELNERVHFDIIHHVNCIGFREPGYLWRLGLPFIWGPVGGTQNYPWRFLGECPPIGALAEGLRNLMNNAQFRFSPRVRRACHAADVLLAANSTCLNDFSNVHGVSPKLMLETGIEKLRPPLKQRVGGNEIRILWSGLLINRKALSLLLKAVAGLPSGIRFRIRVLGDGPLKARWQSVAQRHGIGDHIEWLGHVPYTEVFNQYEWADVFVFTSLRDTSGNVVLEALAAGLPVICLDHQGVGDIVNDDCGIKVPVTNPEGVVEGIREAVISLSVDRQKRRELSGGALNRARNYLWSNRGRQMAAIYRNLIGDGFQWDDTDELERLEVK